MVERTEKIPVRKENRLKSFKTSYKKWRTQQKTQMLSSE